MSRAATSKRRTHLGSLPTTPGLRRLLISLADASLDDAQLSTALAHYLALLASILILGTQGGAPGTDLLSLLVIVLGISGLRVITAGRRLAVSTPVLDALAMAALLAGTGAPRSPFYLLAVAGAWWAGQMDRKRSGLLYAAAFVPAYIALALRPAVIDGAVSTLLEHVFWISALALLADRFHAIDRTAIDLSAALKSAPPGIEAVTVRRQLQRTLGDTDVPVDVVLAAAQVGLTASQAELLGYLVMGLSTNEIADAAALSEATVRYRLTRLYRAMNVRGRRAAASRAHELGLAAWVSAEEPRSARHSEGVRPAS